MTVTAYLRVSTDGQDLEKNKNDILAFANEHSFGKVHWVEEMASGRISWRQRAIARVIDQAAPGDILIVAELSRLGRKMLEIMEILSVATDKGLKVYALKGNWALDGSLQSKIMAMVFAMAAELERELNSSRTKEALAAKRRAGVKLGRPVGVGKSKLDAHALKIKELLASDVPVTAIARRFDCTPGNVHRWLKAHGLK